MRKIRAAACVAAIMLFSLAGCGDDSRRPTGQPAAASTPEVADTQAARPGTVVGNRIAPEVVETKRVCVRYKTVDGKRKCADYENKRTVTDDKDYLLLVRYTDGTEEWVDVDEAEYRQYTATPNMTYP